MKYGKMPPFWAVLALVLAMAVTLPASARAQQSSGADDGSRVLAVIDGRRVITQREVDEMIGPQLFVLLEKIYALRKDALDSLINRIIIEEAARARGVTLEEFSQRLVPKQVDLKQTQVEQILAESAGRFAGMTEDEARQRIRLDIEAREKMDGYKRSVAELREKARVEVLLAAPVPPAVNIPSEGPSRGPADAPVTIIEFSDFQCPYCKQATKTVDEVLGAYGDAVRVVFKHLPLPIHPEAFKAAQAAVCADEQGKFWEFHDRLFDSNDLTVDSLRKQAAEIGLGMKEFDACLDSDSSRAVVLKNLQQARQANIQGTPTFVINGRILKGARGLDDFKRAIDELLRGSSDPRANQMRSDR